MARRNANQFLDKDAVKLKKYFYVLRPLLAIRWIEAGKGLPPVPFTELLDAVAPDDITETVRALLSLKQNTPELGEGPQIPVINDFIFSEFARHGESFCLALVDVDRFKEVNDRHGHLVGDTILTKVISETLRKNLRTMDIAARYGGDEFVLIFPCYNLEEAGRSLETLRAAIAGSHLPLEDSCIAVTVSIGVAQSEIDDDVASLMRRADAALYEAKRAGRNQGFQHNGNCCEPISSEDSAVACS